MDKKRGLIIGGLLIALLLLSLVYAQTAEGATRAIGEVGKFVEDFVTEAEPILERILGKGVGIADFTAGEILFAKLLFLLIILSIIWTALSAVEFINDKKPLLWILSIGAAILATRWISEKLVPMILLPYTTIGVTFAAGLPFLIYFALVEIKLSGDRYRTIRKIAWVFFAIIFIFLWITRYETLKDVTAQQAMWIYPVTALVSIFMIWVDPHIQKYLAKIEAEKTGAVQTRLVARHWREELEKIREDYDRLKGEYRAMHVRTNKKGADAYKADLDFINRELAKLKA